MKWLALLLAALSAGAAFTNRTFTLAFDYDASYASNVTFRVYSSTNAALPLANWNTIDTQSFSNMLLTNITGTAELQFTNRVPAMLPFTLFAVSASNEWGEVFSDPLLTSPPAVGAKLRLR